METVGIDDPPGDISMLDEALGCLGGFDSLLYTRMLAGRATPSERTVVLDIEVKLDVLGQKKLVSHTRH